MYVICINMFCSIQQPVGFFFVNPYVELILFLILQNYTYMWFTVALWWCTGARPVYIVSQLVYTVGAGLMVLLPHPAAVIVLSPCAGVMYATLFTMPYLLVAHYHTHAAVRVGGGGT